MRILIATPLFPPDTAPAAAYAKDLARRLTVSHEVTVVAYSHIPEQVEGVTIRAVSKRQPVLVRLMTFMTALFQEAKGTDVLYVLNGASAELPTALVSQFTRVPLILGMSDTAAHEHAQQSTLHGGVERLIRSRARCVISEMPLLRPEILPLEERDDAAFDRYEASWETHLAELLSNCTYGKE
jgi:hypothetical protein